MTYLKTSDWQGKDGDSRVCLLRNYVKGRSDDIRAEVRAATGSNECLVDQLFRGNLCLGRSFAVTALPSRPLQFIILRPIDTEASTRFERSMVVAYHEEEMGSSDITRIQ